MTAIDHPRPRPRPTPAPEVRPRPAPRPAPGPRTRPLPVRPASLREAPAAGAHRARSDAPRATSRVTHSWGWRTGQWRLFLAVVTVGTTGLHLWRIDSAMDLFIDEPFYSEVGQSIARGSMPYATGSYFFLHPPGFFYVEAAWIKIFGSHDGLFQQVFSLRKLIAVIAGLTALVLAVLVAKAVGRTAGAIVALVYSLNAFANRDSTIVILEPATMLWTLCGYAVLMYLGEKGTARRRNQVIAAGLLFGIACLTKEFAVFVTMLPLALAFVLKCWLTRREALLALVMTVVPYALWMAAVYLTGHWSEYVGQITSGFHRTTGKTQISGFNRPGAPSFLDAILSNLAYLWTAYLILGAGSLAIGYLALRSKHKPRQRLLALFGLGAIPLLGYCVTAGANEEQFFNFLLFPALICLVTVLWNEWHRFRINLRVAAIVIGVAALVSDYTNYLITHTQPDNGSYRVDRWMAENVPDGTPVATTNPVQRQMFLRYTMVDDSDGSVLDRDIRYLVVFYKQVDQGYAFVDRATVDRQTRGQREVFTFTDRSNGRMSIYAIHHKKRRG